MAREIETALNLDRMMREQQLTQKDLAERLGISQSTVSNLRHNRWTVVDRNVLERMATALGCEAGSLFSTKETRFLRPFSSHPAGEHAPLWYLHRPDADTLKDGRRVAKRDDYAIRRITQWLDDAVDAIVLGKKAVTTLKEFEDSTHDHCLTLGSPSVNAASEMAICQAFSSKPFDPSQSKNVPFCFVESNTTGDSAPSSLLRPSNDGKRGIYLKKEKVLLEMDFAPRFYEEPIERGRDCAVIVVTNHKPAQTGMRKLMVLAGSGGVGTEGAAMALVDHHRDLEPLANEQVVWGAIEAIYTKRRNSTDRKLLRYRWRCRYGGRCPVAFGEKKSKAAAG